MGLAMDFNVKIPWWSRVLGTINRWRWERRDRKEKRRLQNAPVYQGTIQGDTAYYDDGKELYRRTTHRWDCYETPSGKRTVKFTRMGGRGIVRQGKDHPAHANAITPWIHHQHELNWRRMRSEGGIWVRQ